jgi:hypothetical protein
MKPGFLFISFLFITNSFISYSQNSEDDSKHSFYKNQLGLEISPFRDRQGDYGGLVYSLRYGYNISQPLTLGIESSESVRSIYGNSQYNNFTIGLFARYSFFTEKRIQGFVEFSPFYSHRYFKGLERLADEVRKNTLGGYIAPGISVYTKNRKFSMDLYYDFYIHPTNIYYNHVNIIAYKVNIHF